MRHGAVVLVGPHWQNFGDAYDALISNGGAIVVRSAEEIAGAARKLLSDEAELGSMRSRANAALATISGALPRTHRGAAALPAGRRRLGACVLTSRPGGIAPSPQPRRHVPAAAGRALRAGRHGALLRAPTPYRSRLPVICVGNFTAGGTGKTPLAIHLCERLKAAGHEPVALTRGYGGRLSGPYWVNANTDVARDVGDEALLLAAPRRRSSPATAGSARAPSRSGRIPCTVIVMDDGLQNPALAKDLTIAVVDGGRGLGNGLVMPAGPLRAPLEFQLELTDAIVVNESAAARRRPARDGMAAPSLRRPGAARERRSRREPPTG